MSHIDEAGNSQGFKIEKQENALRYAPCQVDREHINAFPALFIADMKFTLDDIDLRQKCRCIPAVKQLFGDVTRTERTPEFF